MSDQEKNIAEVFFDSFVDACQGITPGMGRTRCAIALASSTLTLLSIMALASIYIFVDYDNPLLEHDLNVAITVISIAALIGSLGLFCSFHDDRYIYILY